MASSFAYWFHGKPISNTAAGSTNHFAHAYRGAAGSPVVRVGSAQAASASGGFRSSGSAAASLATTVATASGLGLGGDCPAFVGQVVHVGGGLTAGGSPGATVVRAATPSGGARFGGASRSIAATVTAAPFLYWYRGAPISCSSISATGHFDHAYRGRLGYPVASPSLVTSFTATGSGGLRAGGSSRPTRGSIISTTTAVRLGGSADVGRRFSADASGGLAAGGSATIIVASSAVAAGGGASMGGAATAEVAYRVVADGGFEAGGQALAGLSTTALASGGFAPGGRTVASLSAAVATSGGATLGGRGLIIEFGFNIYVNDGHGGPIDYSTPVETVYDLTWTSPVLAAPGNFKFGVRAFSDESSLEERNLDASVQLDLDADGSDVTWVPRPPLGVRALPLAGGRVRVEWNSPTTDRRRRPTGFHVYAQAVALTDYTTPAAVVPSASDLSGTFAVEIGPLVDGVLYAVGVRAFNAIGEEHNSTSCSVGADASPPSPVGSLHATPSARAS